MVQVEGRVRPMVGRGNRDGSPWLLLVCYANGRLSCTCG